MTDFSEKFTIKRKQKEYFSDFLVSFERNPVTGELASVTNELAVKQSLYNLIRTKNGERFYNSKIGTKVYSSLFENYSPELVDPIIHTSVQQAYDQEPRALHEETTISFNENELNIFTYFQLINIPGEVYSLRIPIKVVR